MYHSNEYCMPNFWKIKLVRFITQLINKIENTTKYSWNQDYWCFMYQMVVRVLRHIGGGM